VFVSCLSGHDQASGSTGDTVAVAQHRFALFCVGRSPTTISTHRTTRRSLSVRRCRCRCRQRSTLTSVICSAIRSLARVTLKRTIAHCSWAVERSKSTVTMATTGSRWSNTDIRWSSRVHSSRSFVGLRPICSKHRRKTSREQRSLSVDRPSIVDILSFSTSKTTVRPINRDR
jgi:hypothetical protein